MIRIENIVQFKPVILRSYRLRRPSAAFFTADILTNEQVFSSISWKKNAQIRGVVFENT